MVKRAPWLLVLLFVSCVGGPSPADLATYQAIGKDYVRYVEADLSLTESQRQSRRDLVESWRLRVGAAR